MAFIGFGILQMLRAPQTEPGDNLHVIRQRLPRSTIRKAMHRHIQVIVSVTESLEQPHFESAWKSKFPDVIFSVHAKREPYPPFPGRMRMWKNVSRAAHKNAFDWIVRCDYDSVLSLPLLKKELKPFNSDHPYYLGFVGTGRSQDKGKLHIDEFAMGGGCEVLSLGALKMLDIDECVLESKRVLGAYQDQKGNYHTDVELARCLKLYGILPREFTGAKAFHYLRPGSKTKQIPGYTLCELNAIPKSALVVHPVKTASNWMAIANRHMLLNEPIPSCKCSASPRADYWASSCDRGLYGYTNDSCAVTKPRCPVSFKEITSHVSASFIIGFKAESRLADVPVCITSNANSIPILPLPAHPTCISAGVLTQGECSLLETHKHVLTTALKHYTGPFLVLEDDFLIHKRACERFVSHLACMNQATAAGGIFLPGYTIWHKHYWPHDKSLTCIDATSKTGGTFSMIYSRQAALRALKFFEVTNFTRPIDHMYDFVIQMGSPVQMASPVIFAMDVGHKSLTKEGEKSKFSVRERHSLHRWGPRRDFHFRI